MSVNPRRHDYQRADKAFWRKVREQASALAADSSFKSQRFTGALHQALMRLPYRTHICTQQPQPDYSCIWNAALQNNTFSWSLGLLEQKRENNAIEQTANACQCTSFKVSNRYYDKILTI